MQPIENHTPDTCKPERKLCNRVCGILLIYMLLMNLVVVCAVWIGAGIELIRLGKTGYGMEQALRELASHADQLLQNGTGYLVVSGDVSCDHSTVERSGVFPLGVPSRPDNVIFRLPAVIVHFYGRPSAVLSILHSSGSFV